MEDNCFIIIVLVSATHQDESAIGVHMSPPSWTSLLPSAPSHPCRLSQGTRLSSLCFTANPHWLSLSHTIMDLFPCYFLNSSHPLFPLLCPQVCSLCLCLQEHCIFFFKLIYFNWRLITLQYCSEHCILMVKNRLMFSKGNCYGGAENMNDESNRHAFIS